MPASHAAPNKRSRSGGVRSSPSVPRHSQDEHRRPRCRVKLGEKHAVIDDPSAEVIKALSRVGDARPSALFRLE